MRLATTTTPQDHADHALARPLRRGRRLGIAMLCALSSLACGCLGNRDVAAKLANAAVPAHLPQVKACWEKQFEKAGFQGEYKATVDFNVGPDGALTGTKVTKLEASDKGSDTDTSEFRSCIEQALNQTVLPKNDDANGPGFATSAGVSVTGYVFSFVDGSSRAREEAESRSEHVLIGPRSDRCEGLYRYESPRDEVALYTAIDQADASWQEGQDDPDQYARALQKAYDLRLELRERLKIALEEPDLPKPNRKKLEAAIKEADAKARALGEAIGCKPPAR